VTGSLDATVFIWQWDAESPVTEPVTPLQAPWSWCYIWDDVISMVEKPGGFSHKETHPKYITQRGAIYKK